MIGLSVAGLVLALGIIFPLGILYFSLAFMFVDGVAPRFVEEGLKTSLGPVTISALDVLLVGAALSFFIFISKRLSGVRNRIPETREARIVSALVLAYLLVYFIKGIFGVFEGVPFQSVVRIFSGGAQALFFFLPIVAIKHEKQLRRFFYVALAASFMFPIGQILSAGSFDSKHVLQADGTLRLGFGDAVVLLAFPIIAIFAWNRRLFLAAIPLAGVVMLSHRSGYIGIMVALFAVSFLTGKRIKATIAMVAVVVTAGLTLFILQAMTSLPFLEKGMARIGDTFAPTVTTQARASAWPLVLSVAEENPFTGLSPLHIYNFQRIVGAYDFGRPMNEKEMVAFDVLHAHNFVLTELVYSGLLGTALLLSIIVFSLIHSRRVARVAGYRALGAFIFSSIVFFVIFASMNTTMTSSGYGFWIQVGILYWYVNWITHQSKLRAATPNSKTTIAEGRRIYQAPVVNRPREVRGPRARQPAHRTR